jgi:hypothetical protein
MKRRQLIRVVLGATGAGAIAAVVAWPFLSARQQWDRLDSAADDFRVPRGFTEVARPRQGTGFCWVTCTNGGEAVVTIVLEAAYTDPTQACRALRPAIVDLTGEAADASNQGYCGWVGQLDGSATVFAGAARGANFHRNDGHRWTETVTPPDSPVVAFVEFNSGLE